MALPPILRQNSSKPPVTAPTKKSPGVTLPPLSQRGASVTPAPTAGSTTGWTPPDIAGSPGAKKKPRSLWNQVTDIGSGIIPGFLHMGQQFGLSAIAPFRLGLDVAKGDVSVNNAMALANVGQNPSQMSVAVTEDPGLVDKYMPFQRDTSESFARTAGDIRHPSRYGKAIQEGTILDKILEDTANVSLVAGPLSEGLGMAAEGAAGAGAARTASVLRGAETGVRYVHSVTGPIANAPISIPRRLLTSLDEGAQAGISKLAAGDGRFSDAARNLRGKMPGTFSEQGRAMIQGLKEETGARLRAGSRVSRQLFTEGGLLDKTPETVPTMSEQGAAVAMLSQVASGDELLRIAHPLLTPEEVRKGHVLHDVQEQTYTPDVADVVRQYQDGTLPADQRARVDRYMDAVRNVADKQTARSLVGDGRLKGPIDSDWLGHDPVDGYVAEALGNEGVPRTQIDDMIQRRGAGESWEDIEQSHPELTPILDNPLVWPKPWRPVMRTMALGNETLSAATAKAGGTPVRLPYRPPDLMTMGVEQPKYFSSSPSELAQPLRARPPGERTNLGMGGLRGLSSEQMSVSNEYLPMSARTLGESIGSEAGRMESNRVMIDSVARAKLPTIESVLGPQEAQRIVADATNEAKAQRYSGMQTKRLVGQRLNEALNDAGHSPIIGDLTAPKPGAFDAGAHINYEDIAPDTPAMHTEVKNRLIQRWANKGSGGMPVAVLDWINTKFKGNVLPFSLRWQLGDAIGGAYMAWAGGGIDPATFISAMRQLKTLSPEAVQQLFDHPDFADASLSHGEQNVIRMGPDAPEPKTIIGKAKRASFRLNNAINEANRHSYLLAKTDKLLSEHGLSVETLGNDAQAWAQPEVQHALQSAVDDAMKVMGSFDEMTPVEQRYMKRIFPFWAWYRHITALAMRTAIDNPARMMWTMRLGSIGSDPDSELPPWLKGGIPLPGGLMMPTSGFNPFGDVIGGEPVYTPGGAMRSMSPGIKWGVAALTGADLNKSGKQLTRPYGSKRNPLTDTIYQMAKTFPVTRVAMDMAPQTTVAGIGLGPVARYGSGAPVAKYGTTPRPIKALPLLGLPITTKPKKLGG